MKYYYLNTSKENTTYLTNWTGVYGKSNDVQGVVIHDAAAGINATASDVIKRTVSSINNANYHDVVDDYVVYALINQDNCAYHTADSVGNKHFLGIEIAPSLLSGVFENKKQKDKYYKAWDNACKLSADYLVYYGLNVSTIKFHRDFSATKCPYTMNVFFESYEKALKETKKNVQKYINKLKKGEQ